MTLELLVQLSTLLSVLFGAIGLIVGVVVYRRQMNAQVFLEYTKRYEEIMKSFPTDAYTTRLDLNGEPPPRSPELQLAIVRYLNLCSEEYYLCRQKYLALAVWRIWEAELQRTLRSPLLRREWSVLRKEFESYPDFIRYVERTIAAKERTD